MKWKKAGVISVLLLLVVLLLVSCGNSTNQRSTDTGFSWDAVNNVLAKIGTLSFLGGGDHSSAHDPLIGLLRLLVGILVFAILFELSRVAGLGRNVAIAICIIIAILSVVMIPETILVTISSTYGFLVSFVLIGVPIAGCLYAFFRIPANTVPFMVIRLVLLFLALWLLILVRDNALKLVS